MKAWTDYPFIRLGDLENKSIEVINNVETDKEDIIQDFVSIITSYCARLYGQRRSKRKTEHLIRELTSNDQII